MGRTVILGSINQDIVVSTKRHPSPGETVSGTGPSYLPGGKGANQATAAALAGAESLLIGAVGDDASGRAVLAFLEGRGVDCRCVRVVDAPTGVAIITVDDGGENTIVFVPAANGFATAGDTLLSNGDVLLAQFEVPDAAIIDFFRQGRAVGCLNILNPSPMREVSDELLALVDVLVVNQHELRTLSGATFDRAKEEELANIAGELLPSGNIVVTLGDDGVSTAGRLGAHRLEGHNVQAVDTTGAGDCFVGSLAAGLSFGNPFLEALTYANRAAALCVTKAGAAMSLPTLVEVRDAELSES